VADYCLLTIWRVEGPLEAVYVAIHNSPQRPVWWPDTQKVTALAEKEGGQRRRS
jgi:hypothetical protein